MRAIPMSKHLFVMATNEAKNIFSVDYILVGNHRWTSCNRKLILLLNQVQRSIYVFNLIVGDHHKFYLIWSDYYSSVVTKPYQMHHIIRDGLVDLHHKLPLVYNTEAHILNIAQRSMQTCLSNGRAVNHIVSLVQIEIECDFHQCQPHYVGWDHWKCPLLLDTTQFELAFAFLCLEMIHWAATSKKRNQNLSWRTQFKRDHDGHGLCSVINMQ